MYIPAAILAATVVGIGCAGTAPTTESRQEGAAQIGVQMSALELSEITGLTVTVGPGTGSPSFAPMVVSASRNEDGNWTAYLTNIPAGEGRTFQVVACTGEGACDDTTPEEFRAFEGLATSAVYVGQTAQVYIILQQTEAPNQFNNYAPIINGLSASASTVAPGETVQLSIDASDPDTGTDAGQGPVAYFWLATCGSIQNPTSATPVWTAPSPSEDRDCTLYVTVRDTCAEGQPLACQSTVTASLQVRVRNTGGNAEVIVYPNTCPMVSCVAADQQFTYSADGGFVNGYSADVRIVSADTDGDELRYVWSSPDCVNGTFVTADGGNPTGPITDDGTEGTRSVRFVSNTLSPCTSRVDVRDYWPEGPPADAGLSEDRGCVNTGTLFLGGAVDFQIGPSIIGVMQPSATNLVKPGQTYTFAVDVRDDNLKSAYPLTVSWSSHDGLGTFTNHSPADPSQLTGAGRAQVQWTAPDTLSDSMSLTVRITNTHGLYTEKTFALTR